MFLQSIEVKSVWGAACEMEKGSYENLLLIQKKKALKNDKNKSTKTTEVNLKYK